jgi:hypothetical protein
MSARAFCLYNYLRYGENAMIDLTRNPKLLTESWMKMFGAWNKTLLKYIYGKDVDMIANLNEDQSLNFVIRGEVQDVRAYANAIIAEKEYLETYAAKGKDHPMTNQKRLILDQAIQRFESMTGIKWPFVDEA